MENRCGGGVFDIRRLEKLNYIYRGKSYRDNGRGIRVDRLGV